MNNKKLIFLRILIGFLILFALFYKVGFTNLYNTLISINPIYLFLLFLMTIIIMIVETITYKVLTAAVDKKIPFWRLFKYYITSWSIGLISPGKLGEFSLVYFLKKEDIDLGKGTAMYVLDKSITIFLLILVSVYGFFIFLTKVQALQLIIALLILIFLVIFFLISSPGRKIIVRYILRKYAENFSGFSRTLSFYFKEQKRIILLNIFLTLIKSILQAIAVFFVFLAFGVKVPILPIYIISAIITIVSLIPITVSGLGTREASATFLYSLIGVKASIVISVYIIIIFVHYFLGLLNMLLISKKVMN